MRIFLTLCAALLLLSGCERPPTDAVQHGYRGTGMAQIYNPRTLEQQASLHEAPVPIPKIGRAHV